MEYKDALGHELVVGDRVAYSVVGGALQIGRVLALSTQNVQDYTKKSLPQKILTCEEYKWCKSYHGSCTQKDSHTRGRAKYPMKKIPALKVQGARRKWNGDGFIKLNPSLLTKFENVIAINSNLTATITLI